MTERRAQRSGGRRDPKPVEYEVVLFLLGCRISLFACVYFEKAIVNPKHDACCPMLHSWEKIPRSHTSDPEEVCQLSSPPCHLFEIKFEEVDQIAQSSRALPHPRSAMSLVFASALARLSLIHI